MATMWRGPLPCATARIIGRITTINRRKILSGEQLTAKGEPQNCHVLEAGIPHSTWDSRQQCTASRRSAQLAPNALGFHPPQMSCLI